MEKNQLSLFMKTSPDSSQTRPTHLAAFLERLPEKMVRSSLQGASGQTLVACLVPKEQWRGDSWTPNTSAWHNVADVCSLSQVLETGLIPQRFFLSEKACAGILRRAEKRGKRLPEQLQRALETVANRQEA
jgi:hypothetical protein